MERHEELQGAGKKQLILFVDFHVLDRLLTVRGSCQGQNLTAKDSDAIPSVGNLHLAEFKCAFAIAEQRTPEAFWASAAEKAGRAVWDGREDPVPLH